MENGFIKIYRQIRNWEWYTDSATVHFFIHCILSANWKDKKWQGKEIKRGQFVTSYANLSAQTGLSIKQVRLRIERLQDSGEITYEGASSYSLVTVCKYNTYQPKHIDEGKQKTNKGQSKGNQRATTKEGKEREEGKESIYVFDDFWNDYDKKKERAKCERKWKKVKEKDRELVKEFIPIYKKHQPDKQYRKNPSTFLNNEIWKDDWSEYSPKQENNDRTNSNKGHAETSTYTRDDLYLADL